MNFNKVIEMDIWSGFGCFSKPFTTTGGILTYLIPPKTSIIGMIGAVLGYEFDDYEINSNRKEYVIEKLFDIKISIQPLFDLKTKRVTYNQVEGTVNKPSISNIHQDVLINPYYKLFISFPDSLSFEEEIFIERIKSHQTIYNLYMGKNEFILSYELCNVFDYESININNDNVDEFFQSEMKIYGILNRKLIKDTEMCNKKEHGELKDKMLFVNDKGVTLDSYFEYIIPEYPVKRTNFTEFTYSEISFLAGKKLKENYFSKFLLKDNICKNDFLELIKIGENEWISMV